MLEKPACSSKLQKRGYFFSRRGYRWPRLRPGWKTPRLPKRKQHCVSLAGRQCKPHGNTCAGQSKPQREYGHFFPSDSILRRLTGRAKSQLYSLHRQTQSPYAVTGQPLSPCGRALTCSCSQGRAGEGAERRAWLPNTSRPD